MIKKISRHKALAAVFSAAFAFTLGGFLWAYIVLKGLGNGPLIVHFDDIQGITQVGSIGTLIFMGILGMVVIVVNSIIGMELEDRDPFLGKMTAALTFIFSVLLFIAFVAILNVN